MNLRQAAIGTLIGLVAGVLAVASTGVGPPGGGALLALAALMAVAAWFAAGASRWRRYLGIPIAIAFGIAGAYGVYGLVSLLDDGGISRFNLAVLGVLLLMGTTSAFLFLALAGRAHSAEVATRLEPWRRAASVAVGVILGVGASLLFGIWLSSLTDPPCCSAFGADDDLGVLRRFLSM